MRPHFTVFIPVYNDAGRVGRAVQSVLDQTMPDFELIVSDDCSTDASTQIVREFKDPRLRLIENEKNLGCGGNKNKGLLLASAPLFKALDSDDWLAPNCLERMRDVFEQYPEVALVTAAATEHYESNSAGTKPRENTGPHNCHGLCDGRSFQELYFHGRSAGNPSQVAVRTQWAKAAGGWDERLVNGDEGALWLRIVRERKAFFVSEPLAHITIHQASLTAKASRTGLEALHVAQMFRDVLRDMPELNTISNRFWLVWTRGYQWFFRASKLFLNRQITDALRCWFEIARFAPSLWWVPVFSARACCRLLLKTFQQSCHYRCETSKKATV